MSSQQKIEDIHLQVLGYNSEPAKYCHFFKGIAWPRNYNCAKKRTVM